jgi:hypothetical protein
MHRVTVKTSTIFIAKRGPTQVYRSVGEIPAPLRKELEESTNSFNSATILIADRRGREEIVKALNGLPSSLRSRLASSLTPRATAEPAVGERESQSEGGQGSSESHARTWEYALRRALQWLVAPFRAWARSRTQDPPQ